MSPEKNSFHLENVARRQLISVLSFRTTKAEKSREDLI